MSSSRWPAMAKVALATRMPKRSEPPSRLLTISLAGTGVLLTRYIVKALHPGVAARGSVQPNQLTFDDHVVGGGDVDRAGAGREVQGLRFEAKRSREFKIYITLEQPDNRAGIGGSDFKNLLTVCVPDTNRFVLFESDGC